MSDFVMLTEVYERSGTEKFSYLPDGGRKVSIEESFSTRPILINVGHIAHVRETLMRAPKRSDGVPGLEELGHDQRFTKICMSQQASFANGCIIVVGDLEAVVAKVREVSK